MARQDPNVEKGLRVWRHLSGRVSLYDSAPQELSNGYRDHNRDHNRSLRRPDATALFIRNNYLTSEKDVRALFEPYALRTNNKIISVSINPTRGYGFVNFDGPEPMVLLWSIGTVLREEEGKPHHHL